MSDGLLSKIAGYLAEQNREKQADEEILLFGLRLLVYSVLSYVTVFVLAWALGIFVPTASALLAGSLLRVFSGGGHASSPVKCTVYGTIVYLFLGFAAARISEFGYEAFVTAMVLIFLFSLFTLWRYAPAETPGKPISSKLQRAVLRRNSFIVLAVIMLFLVGGLILAPNLNDGVQWGILLGLFWQSVSLYPPVGRALHSL